MRKGLLYILITLLLVLTAIVWYFGDRSDAVKVMTEKSSLQRITETVAANGKIKPAVDVKISPDVSGEIVKLVVREGERVKKGDLLAKIRPDVYESALNRAEAALNNAKANLANSRARLVQVKARARNAKAEFQRKEKLYEQEVISQAEFQKAETEFEATQADVEAAKETVEASRFSVMSAEASLKEARDKLEKTVINAPTSGTISALDVEEGERVVGTAQMAGTEMMRVSDLEVMEVDVEVNENDIVRVEVGDTADVEADAYLDETFKGVVTEIANAATSGGQSLDEVTLFSVKIRLLRDSYEHLIRANGQQVPFRPGMSATVDIRTETVEDALAVPIRAVTTRKTERKERNTCVFKVQEGYADQVTVKTGIQDDEYIHILEGLKEDEAVITGPYDAVSDKLSDSTRVEVVSKSELFGEGEG